MGIDNQLLEDIRLGKYKEKHLDLSGKNLCDQDIIKLVSALASNPNITNLDLRNNLLTNESANLLAKNTTLRILRLKDGNAQITVSGLQAFSTNTTLTSLVFRGGGNIAQQIRSHMNDNRKRQNQPKTQQASFTVQPPAPVNPVTDLQQQQAQTAIVIPQLPNVNANKNTNPNHTTAAKTEVSATKNYETEEDGETSFQTLYANLMLDMAKYSGNLNLLIMYSSLVTNMFMHAATYSPLAGYGKAQKREFDNKSQLQYYRSQGNHANAKFFRDLIKTQGEKRKSRLPLNRGFLKLISPPDFSEKFCLAIKKFDPETGYLKPGEKVGSFVSEKIAHAGARRNNFSTLVSGMKIAAVGLTSDTARNTLQEKLRAILPPTKTVENLTPQVLSARIHDLFTRFKTLQQTEPQDLSTNHQLSSQLLAYRVQRIQSLTQKITKENLRKISIDNSYKNATCIMIRLYPECTKNNDTYKEGVTNVLLSFFAALLNHNLKQKGLSLHVERRQSFGFLRPMLTDAGNLTIRLSLGLEPTAFDDVVIQSIQELNSLLTKFDFTNPTTETLKRAFTEMPKKAKKEPEKKAQEKKARKTRASDTYIRNIARKDNNVLSTFRQAEAYLSQAYTNNASNYLENAMENFLSSYVVEKKILPLPIPIKEKRSIIQPCSSQIVELLKSILNYAVNFAAKLKFLASDEPLDKFAHCFWHSLLKLHSNCTEAQDLLKNLEKTDMAEFYNRAILLSENILEYLISLDGLKQIRDELQGKLVDPIAKLRATEIAYAETSLNLPKSQIELYFTDNGQQAITTSLLVLSTMLHGTSTDGKAHDHEVYVHGKSYFEVASFMADAKKDGASLETSALTDAKIVFTDITQLEHLNLNDCKAIQALVIDLTHHPLFDQDALKTTIKTVSQKGKWVILVESALKHEQLGLDKYQCGKITTIAPPKQQLPDAAKDLFKAVDADAIHPCVASYLQMVNDICQEKTPNPGSPKLTDAPKIKTLDGIGIFNKPTSSTANATTLAPESDSFNF